MSDYSLFHHKAEIYTPDLAKIAQATLSPYGTPGAVALTTTLATDEDDDLVLTNAAGYIVYGEGGHLSRYDLNYAGTERQMALGGASFALLSRVDIADATGDLLEAMEGDEATGAEIAVFRDGICLVSDQAEAHLAGATPETLQAAIDRSFRLISAHAQSAHADLDFLEAGCRFVTDTIAAMDGLRERGVIRIARTRSAPGDA